VRAISWIAISVFRESVRDRVPYNLVIFAVLLIASSFLIGQLTAGQDVRPDRPSAGRSETTRR